MAEPYESNANEKQQRTVLIEALTDQYEPKSVKKQRTQSNQGVEYTFDWSNDLILRMIDLYKQNDILWNNKQINHYNKKLKSETWQRIADEMGCSELDCRRKMTSVLSSFRREKCRIRHAAESGNTDFQSSWFAFNKLLFLLERSKSFNDKIVKEEILVDEHNLSEYYISNSPPSSPPPLKKMTLSPNNIREEEEEEDDQEQDNVEMIQNPEFVICKNDSRAFQRDDDDFDRIGSVWANKLRQMDHIQRLHCENIINQALYKGSLNLLHENTQLL